MFQNATPCSLLDVRRLLGGACASIFISSEASLCFLLGSLVMEAVYSSETLVQFYLTIWGYV
jgi:hypothetical protein